MKEKMDSRKVMGMLINSEIDFKVVSGWDYSDIVLYPKNYSIEEGNYLTLCRLLDESDEFDFIVKNEVEDGNKFKTITSYEDLAGVLKQYKFLYYK